MFKVLLTFLRLFSKPLPTSIIENGKLPVCVNCHFYRPTLYTFFDPSLAKCSKFGTKDILTGHITYKFADLCRRYEDKCGEEGKEYVEKEKWF